MKSLDNYDLRISAGMAFRTDMKVSINELINRLNEVNETIFLKESLTQKDVEYVLFQELYEQLLTIFNFLYSCNIMSSSSYKFYIDELILMELDMLDFLID